MRSKEMKFSNFDYNGQISIQGGWNFTEMRITMLEIPVESQR